MKKVVKGLYKISVLEAALFIMVSCASGKINPALFGKSSENSALSASPLRTILTVHRLIYQNGHAVRNGRESIKTHGATIV